jgi:hypothetical protein
VWKVYEKRDIQNEDYDDDDKKNYTHTQLFVFSNFYTILYIVLCRYLSEKDWQR